MAVLYNECLAYLLTCIILLNFLLREITWGEITWEGTETVQVTPLRRTLGWSVCLPLLISPCTMKSRSSLLAPAHPGGPGKKGLKTVVVWCGSYYVRLQYGEMSEYVESW